MSNPTPELELLARQAARAGGDVVRARVDAVGAIRAKNTSTDLVSESDIASGVAIVTALLEAAPDAHIMIEEPEVYEILHIAPGSFDDDEVWVIDPIDGTTSFVHGFPAFSVSVALLRNGDPVAGAVYGVPLDEMFSASRGGGASRNGAPIQVSSAQSVQESLLVTGFPYDRGAPLDIQLDVLAAMLRHPVHGIRRDGTAALDLCHVACGRADGFWEYDLKLWDMAAGALICTEAGARITDIDGTPWTATTKNICAANPVLHAEMLDVISAATS